MDSSRPVVAVPPEDEAHEDLVEVGSEIVALLEAIEADDDGAREVEEEEEGMDDGTKQEKKAALCLHRLQTEQQYSRLNTI